MQVHCNGLAWSRRNRRVSRGEVTHSGETKKFKRYETMVQRAFGTQINAWVFFFFMCIPAGKVSRALGTRVRKQEISIVAVSTLVLWDCCIQARTHLRTPEHGAHQSDLIKWEYCNSQLFRSNLERFTCVHTGAVAVWFSLDWPLTSLLRTTKPPLSTTATASLPLLLSLHPFPPIGSQPVTLT